jgi:hypothetical protein
MELNKAAAATLGMRTHRSDGDGGKYNCCSQMQWVPFLADLDGGGVLKGYRNI